MTDDMYERKDDLVHDEPHEGDLMALTFTAHKKKNDELDHGRGHDRDASTQGRVS